MLNERYKGIAFEKRFLPRLTTEEVKELSKEDALIILPVGAIEQHGPHLPIYTDTLIGEGLLNQAFELLNEEDNIWVLPPLPYGKSTEHLGMPGTMTLSAATLQAVVTDIAKSVHASGFKRLLLFNTHGGNHDLLNMISREIRIETGMMVFRLNPGSSKTNDLITEREQKLGIHGGDVETSMVLDFKNNWVHPDKSPTEFVTLPENTKHLYLKGTSYFAWVINDISTTGVAGDATQATIEKGMEINQYVSESIAEALREMCNFDIDMLTNKMVKQ
ncbi:creatininase family protein [Metabacillus halosaccharovorans]|uniref:creatininase family protein n=1 Tax=Metabacillus halosaccharovorans TaxID=930124 RepID=UPI00203B248B|nr:creatininase family protein [Metabacillus halosaccharovorans]MCM3440199.1 creatininase family protein [Metabacillus halosaccharovorans]